MFSKVRRTTATLLTPIGRPCSDLLATVVCYCELSDPAILLATSCLKKRPLAKQSPREDLPNRDYTSRPTGQVATGRRTSIGACLRVEIYQLLLAGVTREPDAQEGVPEIARPRKHAWPDSDNGIDEHQSVVVACAEKIGLQRAFHDSLGLQRPIKLLAQSIMHPTNDRHTHVLTTSQQLAADKAADADS